MHTYTPAGIFYKQLIPYPSDTPLPEAAQDGMPPEADGSVQYRPLCAYGSLDSWRIHSPHELLRYSGTCDH